MLWQKPRRDFHGPAGGKDEALALKQSSRIVVANIDQEKGA